MEKHQKLKIRQRGYMVPNSDPAEFVLVYENDPVPTLPDGTPMKKVWDNDVETHSVITAHVHQDGDVD